MTEIEFDVERFAKEAEKWDNKYLEATINAVELYEDPREVASSIQKFLSPRYRYDFKAVNPYSKRIWMKELLTSFLEFRKGEVRWDDKLQEGTIACFLVTFIDAGWCFSVNNIQFDLNVAKQKIRNALTDLSFIACFEAACYKNEHWVTDGVRGKLVCFHCHALVWATSRSQLLRRRKQIKPRFAAVLGNKSGVRFDTLNAQEDLCQAIRYQAKMPLLGYRTYVNRRGRKNQVHAKLSLKTRYSLFVALQNYGLLDFWLSGGEGAQIIREARNSLKRHRRYRNRRPGVRHVRSQLGFSRLSRTSISG